MRAVGGGVSGVAASWGGGLTGSACEGERLERRGVDGEDGRHRCGWFEGVRGEVAGVDEVRWGCGDGTNGVSWGRRGAL